jgi:uncharacterized damage-inducible protein DinB
MAVDLLANGFSRIPRIIGGATAGLTARQLATPPVTGSNSIAWLAWHTARGQDAWVSDLEESEAIWTTGGWYGQFDLAFGPDENGFGMATDDAAGVVATRDLLTGYLDAVTARTIAYISALTEEDLADVVDSTRTPLVTRGIQLMSILDDGLQHAGQASYARGILDQFQTIG